MTLTHPRSTVQLMLALALVAGASIAQAQMPAGGTKQPMWGVKSIELHSSRPVQHVSSTAGVITTPFTVKNTTADSLLLTPVLTLPAGWRLVSPVPESRLAPQGTDLWLVSVATPANLPAGRYVVRADMRVARVNKVSTREVWGVTEQRDSAVVIVDERRELDIRVLDAPTFVTAGDTYEARFIVRNRGNVVARVKAHAKSNRGNASTLDATRLDLAPGASAMIRASVLVAGGDVRSAQDLLEVAITGIDGDTTRAETSVETTVIPKAGKAPTQYWSVPGELLIRAAAPGTGVSPVVARGYGQLSPDHNTTIEYSLHSSAGPQSVFGERDDYRLAIRGNNGSIRLGDNAFGFSQLTTLGIQGRGAELSGAAAGLVAGAYGQRNRWTPGAPTEFGGMIGTSPLRAGAISGMMIQRGSADNSMRTVAAAAHQDFRGTRLDLEAAKSDSALSAGTATLARLYGSTRFFSYDIGTVQASDAFSGPQRASSDEHATLSLPAIGPLMVTALAATHSSRPTTPSSFVQRTSTASLSANLRNGNGLEYDRYERHDGSALGGVRGIEQSLRLRTRLAFGSIDLQGSVQNGIVDNSDSSTRHGFTTLSASIRGRLGRESYLSLFADLADGNSLGGGGIGTLSAGTTGELRLPLGTLLRLAATATTQRDQPEFWSGQADVSIERQVARSIVALKARVSQYGAQANSATHLFFVEVRTPLHVRSARLPTAGRAQAQIVDAETGRGISGALVRVGDQASVTNAGGIANFSGLEPGEYNAIIESGIPAGQLVTGGRAIKVVSGTQVPVSFQMSVGRGARIMASLRQYQAKRISGPAADSLVDIGGVSQTIVALIGPSDTLWQSSDDRGHVDFGSVQPGTYTVAIIDADVPEHYAFEQTRYDITVSAGEQRLVDIRLLPKLRSIQFIGGETSLIAAPTKPPIPPAARPKRHP